MRSWGKEFMTIESDLQGQMEQVIYSYFTNLKYTVEPNKLWNRNTTHPQLN